MRARSLLDAMMRPAAAMMQPPPGMGLDFSRPQGEPALLDPDSLSWSIFKNPVTVFIGGVTAVILELAEPSVRSGVWDHSSFRSDAVTRLRRTGAAAMMTVYGPASAAREMIAHVVRLHDRVTGQTPAGEAYRANDPRLLDWVQATASFGFIQAYARFARALSAEEISHAFAEGAVPARLYGATGAPESLAAWDTLYARTLPRLERSQIVFDFLAIMKQAPLLPRPLRPVQHLLVRAGVTLVPPELSARLGIEAEVLSGAGMHLVGLAARLADRIPLRDATPAQASLRVGRDADLLYR